MKPLDCGLRSPRATRRGEIADCGATNKLSTASRNCRSRTWLLLLCAVGPLGAPPGGSFSAAQQPPVQRGADRGVFHILSNGREIGVERFEIVPTAEGVRATAELQISLEGTGRMTETATLVLRRGVEPASYERIQKSPKRGSAIVTFGPDKASAHYKTTQGGVQDMEYFVPKNVVVLDTNFFHHYTFLIRRYDFLKGGPQHIDVLVPQEAAPGMVRVEFIGADQSLRKLVAHTDELDIEIWADDAGRLMKLAVPAAKVEVIREAK